MEKFKKVLEEYGRWSGMKIYSDRIEAHIHNDFSLSLENAKALLEAISKEICCSKEIKVETTASINNTLRKAFTAIGYNNSSLVTQVSSALATIGQQMGELRNEIGLTSHGRTLEELEERNNKVDELTKEFLMDTTEIIACFLIRAFENEAPGLNSEVVEYIDNEAFNEFWDNIHGEFEMGDYSYTASEVLFYVDYPAYLSEHKSFMELGEGENDDE